MSKVNDDLIFKLRERLINLNTITGDKFEDIKLMRDLKEDFEDYLKNNKDNEHKHIENSIYALEALIDYNIRDNRKSAYQLILPMLENLEFGENIELTKSNYNKCLLFFCITLNENYKKAQIIVKTLEKSVETYDTKENLKLKVLSSAYINLAENMLNTNIYDKMEDEERKELTALFAETCDKARKMLFENKMYSLLSILTLKESVFYSKNDTPDDIERIKRLRKKMTKDEINHMESIKYRGMGVLMWFLL